MVDGRHGDKRSGGQQRCAAVLRSAARQTHSVSMTFLSSFRIGQQALYPEELRERLESFSLLENVGDAALRHLLSEANWFGLPGGTLLDRDGENAAALFLVVTGCLGVF